jgi:hypothetical protein
MSKFVLLLSLCALVASAVAIWKVQELEKRGAARPPASEPFLSAEHSSDEQVRQVLYEARKLLQDQVADTLKDIDWRLSRIESLREATEDGLEAAERTATEAGSNAFGRLEAMEARLAAMGQGGEELNALRATLGALAERLQAVEERPAQIIREVGGGGGAAKPVDEGPKRPTLPGAAAKDPALVAQEVEKAKTDIQSDDLNVVFPAIEKVREHRILEAVPRLIEILGAFPEEFGRTAAAAALGRMEIADAVSALADAVTDKSSMVAQQANKSIRQITGFDSELSPSARVRERRTVRNKIKEWWRAHEAEVRARLGQPAGGG